MPSQTFCPKFDAEKLLFETFYGIMRIFGSVHPESECNFPFLYNLIFKPYHISRPLATLRGKIDICPRALSCPKFDAEKLLFEAFFGIMLIFASVQSKSECNFPFLYNLIFQPYHLSSPLALLQGEIDICPHRLFCLKFDAEKLLFEAFFWNIAYFRQCSAQN